MKKILTTIILLFSSLSFAIETTQIDISRDPGLIQHGQIESEMEQRLNQLLKQINEAGQLIKKRDFGSAKAIVNTMQKGLQETQQSMQKKRHYQEILKFVDATLENLEDCESAIDKGSRDKALKDLTEAYRRLKTLEQADNPVFNMTAAAISLDRASQYVNQKDYQSAEVFLDEAIKYITQIQKTSPLSSKKLNELKSEVILTKQQATMGQLKDNKRLRRLQPSLTAAQRDGINNYYELWGESDLPPL